MFNPDISVIGNFLGVAGKNPLCDEPPLQLTEVEVAFQAVVDPYARADFFLAAARRVSRWRKGTSRSPHCRRASREGRQDAGAVRQGQHDAHAHPAVGRSAARDAETWSAAKKGSASGLSVSRLIPNSLMFLEATGEVYRGDSDVFQSESALALSYLGRIRGYRDLTEDPTSILACRTPMARAPWSLASASSRIGVDATFRYRPLRRAIYRRFVARTGADLEPPGPAVGPAARRSASTERGLPIRAALVRRRALDRSGRALEDGVHDPGGSLS